MLYYPGRIEAPCPKGGASRQGHIIHSVPLAPPARRGQGHFPADRIGTKHSKERPDKMKKTILSLLFLLEILFLMIPYRLHAFSEATHLYIADHVFQDSAEKEDLHYGSVAPDIDFFVKRPEKWLTAFRDTHYDFVDLRPFALTPSQAAFANGWFTHNERDPWGADHFAHIDPGYVVEKAKQLTGLPADFGHLAIEVAVDVMLRDNDDPELGNKLLIALQRHSLEDRSLLIDLFVTDQQKTDRLTLILAEFNLRQIMVQYARALSLPAPGNKQAIAEWGSMLARRLYHANIPSSTLLNYLLDAIDLVKDDYKETVDAVIQGIKDNLE